MTKKSFEEIEKALKDTSDEILSDVTSSLDQGAVEHARSLTNLNAQLVALMHVLKEKGILGDADEKKHLKLTNELKGPFLKMFIGMATEDSFLEKCGTLEGLRILGSEETNNVLEEVTSIINKNEQT
jgi:hypothetical protein